MWGKRALFGTSNLHQPSLSSPMAAPMVRAQLGLIHLTCRVALQPAMPCKFHWEFNFLFACVNPLLNVDCMISGSPAVLPRICQDVHQHVGFNEDVKCIGFQVTVNLDSTIQVIVSSLIVCMPAPVLLVCCWFRVAPAPRMLCMVVLSGLYAWPDCKMRTSYHI